MSAYPLGLEINDVLADWCAVDAGETIVANVDAARTPAKAETGRRKDRLAKLLYRAGDEPKQLAMLLVLMSLANMAKQFCLTRCRS